MQKTIFLSTAEAEYYVAFDMPVAIEVIYLWNLLANMRFPQCTPVYEDTTACIEWGNHVIGGRERAKHMDLREHVAHETIQNRMMRLIKIDTSKQLADIFTKLVAHVHFIGCICRILGDPRRNASQRVHTAGQTTLRRAWRLRRGSPCSSEMIIE
jgi:hypothetical protein